jgi:hypothetical protein
VNTLFDIHTGIATLWDSTSLEELFTRYWGTGEAAEFDALLDQEADPKQPWPYCVYELMPANIAGRMTAGGNSQPAQHNRNILTECTLRFHVHTKETSSSSAKALNLALCSELTKVFGGHPAEISKPVPLTYGAVLLQQFVSHAGEMTGDEEYKSVLTYDLTTDTPVAE